MAKEWLNVIKLAIKITKIIIPQEEPADKYCIILFSHFEFFLRPSNP
jgi:hypothetical protein